MPLNNNFFFDPDNLQWEFVRSSGPGGQNVNKVATAVQLRFDVRSCHSLPEDVKLRLIKVAGKRLTNDGKIIITARTYRTQHRNREAALSRLMILIQKALVKPKPRKRTQPSHTAKQKRLDAKRRHSEKKRRRQRIKD